MHGNSKWYLDNGCSNIITEDKNILSLFTPKRGNFASYGDNKGKIIGSKTIGKSPNPTFELFLLLKFYNTIYLVLSKLYGKYNRV